MLKMVSNRKSLILERNEGFYTMILYIIRHGETDYNTVRKLQGWLDQPLNQNGRDLASLTGEALQDVRFDLCITSPLSRSYETAQIILESSKNETVEIRVDERIKEISFGEWEGLCCARQHYEIPDDDFERFFRDPIDMEPFPGGENVQMLSKRTGDFYRELIAREDLQDKTIMISTHGCATRALLRNVYGENEPFWHGHVPPNCAVNIVKVENGISTLLEDDKIYYDPTLCIRHY